MRRKFVLDITNEVKLTSSKCKGIKQQQFLNMPHVFSRSCLDAHNYGTYFMLLLSKMYSLMSFNSDKSE